MRPLVPTSDKDSVVIILKTNLVTFFCAWNCLNSLCGICENISPVILTALTVIFNQNVWDPRSQVMVQIDRLSIIHEYKVLSLFGFGTSTNYQDLEMVGVGCRVAETHLVQLVLKPYHNLNK